MSETMGPAVGTEAWPELRWADWGPTKKTLQMCAQMLGKTRVALDPPQPEWLHTCLYLDGRGFVTGPVPKGGGLLTVHIDVYNAVIRLELSDGRRTSVPLAPARCVADIWSDYREALTRLGVQAEIWEKPQELADTTPFSENRHDCVFDPEASQRFYRLLAAIHPVFDEFRSPFFGRTSVQFWWGAFDYAVLLFDGRPAAAPDDRGYIMRYDLDAGHLNAGFWPGDEDNPPNFYAYIHPRPDGCETARVEPAAHVGWVEAMGEWMLPYDVVRASPDPCAMLRTFLDSVYEVAVDRGGWDAEAHRYTLPVPAPRGRSRP